MKVQISIRVFASTCLMRRHNGFVNKLIIAENDT